jgi:nucleoid-associated protein YgaU
VARLISLACILLAALSAVACGREAAAPPAPTVAPTAAPAGDGPRDSPRVTANPAVPPTWTPAAVATAAAPPPRPTSAASSAATPDATAGPANTYTVERGDTLGEIAEQFGVSLADLVAANGIADVDHIEVGQVLVIP